MDYRERLWSLEPERRIHMLKILLENSKKLNMEKESELFKRWLEESLSKPSTPIDRKENISPA